MHVINLQSSQELFVCCHFYLDKGMIHSTRFDLSGEKKIVTGYKHISFFKELFKSYSDKLSFVLKIIFWGVNMQFEKCKHVSFIHDVHPVTAHSNELYYISVYYLCHATDLPAPSDGSICAGHHFLYQLLWGTHTSRSVFVCSAVLTRSLLLHLYAHPLIDGLILMATPFNTSVSSQWGEEGSSLSCGHLSEFNFSSNNTMALFYVVIVAWRFTLFLDWC